jgi:nucleoside-diphosphate-sugar epimerase
MIRNNVEGTAKVVNAALSQGIGRICHVSSNSALGRSLDGSPATEETKYIPSKRNSGYSVSKFFSEAEIWRGVAEGLEAIVILPSVIIGPGNWSNGSARFFPVIDKGFRFYTDGVTGYVDARDVADAIVLVTEEENFKKAGNQKFLINGENLVYRDFFGMIADALHKPHPAVRATPFMTGTAWRAAAFWSLLSGITPAVTKETASVSTQKSYFDGSKITRMFDFSYRTIPEAIQNTAACYLNDFRR